jgi:glycine dehydrogenase
LFAQLEKWLAKISGFAAVSFQPNTGSQGEYTGLLVKKNHEDRGQSHRDLCFIPHSAHGTNPASAIMAGLKAVEIACAPHGRIASGCRVEASLLPRAGGIPHPLDA